MTDTVIHATDADFDSQVLASDQPVLVEAACLIEIFLETVCRHHAPYPARQAV